MEDNSTMKLSKNNFLTVYPEFSHRFSHMNMDLQDYIVADEQVIAIYNQRQKQGELDIDLDRQNDDQMEDQVNLLIDQFNSDN